MSYTWLLRTLYELHVPKLGMLRRAMELAPVLLGIGICILLGTTGLLLGLDQLLQQR